MDDVRKFLQDLAKELSQEYEAVFGWPDSFMNAGNLVQLLIITRDKEYSGVLEDDGLPVERDYNAWGTFAYHKGNKGKFVIITPHKKRRIEIGYTDELKKILDDFYSQHKDDWKLYDNPEKLV